MQFQEKHNRRAFGISCDRNGCARSWAVFHRKTSLLARLLRALWAFVREHKAWWIVSVVAMLVSRESPAEAVPLLERAVRWIDDDIDTLITLGRAHQVLGHTAEAAAVYARARQLEPNHPDLPKP